MCASELDADEAFGLYAASVDLCIKPSHGFQDRMRRIRAKEPQRSFAQAYDIIPIPVMYVQSIAMLVEEKEQSAQARILVACA